MKRSLDKEMMDLAGLPARRSTARLGGAMER